VRVTVVLAGAVVVAVVVVVAAVAVTVVNFKHYFINHLLSTILVG
jgi:hypothetical protein